MPNRPAEPQRSRDPHSVGRTVISVQPTSFDSVVKRLQDECRLAVDIPCTQLIR